MKTFNTVIEYGVITLILFTSLAFGTVEVWSIAIMELILLTLIALWFIKIVYEGEVMFVKTPLNLPILLFIGLIILQLIPFPIWLLKVIPGNNHQIYIDTYTSLSLMMNSLNPLSLYPQATTVELFKILTYSGLFFLMINNIRDKKQIDRLLKAIVGFGLFLALFGIIQHLTGNGRIYWFKETRIGIGGFFGPFFNRNYFASYMGMIIPIGLSLFTSFLVTYPIGQGLRKRLVSMKGDIHRPIFFVFSSVIMAVALFLTLSRGGILSFMLSMIFFAIFLRLSSPVRKKAPIVFILLTLTIAYLLWIGISPVLERLSTLYYNEDVLMQRWDIWIATLSMFKDFPALGTGLGTFQYIFPAYKPYSSFAITTHAENDYLQLLSEVGVIGGGLVLWFLIAIFWISIKGIFSNDAKESIRYRQIGLTSGLIPVLIYSMAERNLYIPALAILFVMLVALICVNHNIVGSTQ